jgi:dimethylaniline monooxygenase (N-oxide forming)
MEENNLAVGEEGVIQVGWSVSQTVQLPDRSWEVHLFRTDDEKETKVVTVDWVVVCSGQHQVKNDSKIAGVQAFQGEVVHTSDYINAIPFTGKNVMIIGGGDSGADIVKHVADVAANTYVSLRHGAHVTPRYFPGDRFPIDYAMYRFSFYMPHFVRVFLRDRGIKGHFARVIAETGNPIVKQIVRLLDLNGLSEEEYFTTKSAMMCESFATRKALMKTEVAIMTEHGARFKPRPRDNDLAGDDAEVKELDAVIVATGFTQTFGFLPHKYQKHRHLDRYKLVFHPNLSQMAFIGFVRPSGLGAIPPLAEMQARWVSCVVGERVDLPSPVKMMEDAAAARNIFQSVRKFNNEMLVTYSYYATMIANEIGVQPHMFKILQEDPQFWWKLLFHPFTMHQFRLHGIHAKPKVARDIIDNKISFPELDHPSPLKRTHPAILFFATTLFGVLSQVPFIGNHFKPGIQPYNTVEE